MWFEMKHFFRSQSAYSHLFRIQSDACRTPTAGRGYRKLLLDTVTQADMGVDFDFLRAEKMTGSFSRSK